MLKFGTYLRACPHRDKTDDYVNDDVNDYGYGHVVVDMHVDVVGRSSFSARPVAPKIPRKPRRVREPSGSPLEPISPPFNVRPSGDAEIRNVSAGFRYQPDRTDDYVNDDVNAYGCGHVVVDVHVDVVVRS
jgi:hypothetical protein